MERQKAQLSGRVSEVSPVLPTQTGGDRRWPTDWPGCRDLMLGEDNDSPYWAKTDGFITEPQNVSSPGKQNALTDADRRDAGRLKLRNVLEGGHAADAVQLLDEDPSRANDPIGEDGRLPLHVALERKPIPEVGMSDACTSENAAPICLLAKLHPKACQVGDKRRRSALPLHIALEMDHEDVVVWELLRQYPKAAAQRSPVTDKLPLVQAIERRREAGIVAELINSHRAATGIQDVEVCQTSRK